MKAFRACLEAFWLSSFYFGLGIIIAGLAVNVIEVLTCLRQWYRPDHTHLANAFLLIMAILLLVWSILASKINNWSTGWELYYFYNLPSRRKALFFVLIPLGTTPQILIFFVARFVWKRYRLRPTSLSKVLQRMLKAWSFLIMWISLGFFVQLRSEISDVVGDSYAENEWGFGQVLAILALVPMFVEFGKNLDLG